MTVSSKEQDRQELLNKEVTDVEHWEAIARFSDGTELRFNRPYTAAGNFSAENQEQYEIEEELLNKAVDTGKEVETYSVVYVDD